MRKYWGEAMGVKLGDIVDSPSGSSCSTHAHPHKPSGHHMERFLVPMVLKTMCGVGMAVMYSGLTLKF